MSLGIGARKISGLGVSDSTEKPNKGQETRSDSEHDHAQTQLKKWKNPRKFQRTVIEAGFDPKEAYRIWIKMNRWQSVMRRPVRFVMNLDWFRERGLVFLHDYTIAFSRT